MKTQAEKNYEQLREYQEIESDAERIKAVLTDSIRSLKLIRCIDSDYFEGNIQYIIGMLQNEIN